MVATTQGIEDKPRSGILLMLGAWLMFAFVDTGAKWLAVAGIVSFQLAFMRYFGHFVIATALMLRDGVNADAFRLSHPWQVVTRALLLISATISNFYVLQFLPLTVVSAIMFSSPVIVCFLSIWLLNEQVGPWRWGAIVLGFVGVLIVVRPFGTAFHPTMLMVIYNATALALYSIMTRQLAGVVSTDTMQFYMGMLGTAVLLPFAIWVWQSPGGALDWTILISIGVFGWAGHQMLTVAHRFATANTLMPFTYSFMIYLAILSFFVFGHIPDAWTVVGALVIVMSGLIIWRREQV